GRLRVDWRPCRDYPAYPGARAAAGRLRGPRSPAARGRAGDPNGPPPPGRTVTVFRRRRKSEDAVDQFDQAEGLDSAEDAEQSGEYEEGAGSDAEERIGLPPAPRPDGPWDVSEVEKPHEGRVDLGGLLIPGVEGM